ncbi:MAG: hypothetical protein G3M78_05420 [Candidatus Nitrohelix vancouverensis]|uniref:Endonuclease I n=1 Tax=Candidatus Nitrohelix vancouverensis TaxID=2705534 RepID=A0A7T0C1J9_9BACT|nr:MAG: hypothetical protein G3M78_05420 [Candidatus Nitrohelix vancouverensis]
MVSAEISKNELKQIYMAGNHARTFHCGCLFDKLKQTSTKACLRQDPANQPKATSQFMDWMLAMPSATFGESLSCWKQDSCANGSGDSDSRTRCCSRKSPRFKRMQSDMHNLFPSIKTTLEKNALQEDLPFGGMEEYKFCKVDGKPGLLPHPKVQGDLARSWFYMSFLYKVDLSPQLEDQLRSWHFQDPPDPWEEKRNGMIELVQGNRNPFIDHPELVERVPDF